MKSITIILFVCGSFACSAQISFVQKAGIQIKSDTMSIEGAFKLLDQLAPKKYFDRYVVKNGTTYYRPGIQWFRKRTYIEKNGSLFLIKPK